MLYLDDIMNAYWKKRGLVITDWNFGEGMETNSEGEKVKKTKEWQNIMHAFKNDTQVYY